MSTALRVFWLVLFGGGIAAPAFGGELGGTPSQVEIAQTRLDYVWTVFAAILVFFMQAGFSLVESGFSRARNAVNIIMKNFMDASAGILSFFIIGFGIMFGTSWAGLIGTDGFALIGLGDQPQSWAYAFWFFQAVFAATSATIVSGAVTDRIKFSGYLVFTIVMTALIYPIFGAWAWGGLFNGGGWLESLGFIDFAGSTVVHSVGGWAALAGAIVVGPRVGKYKEDGTPTEMASHNLPFAALGVFILWLGWFGFNAGSTTAGTTAIAKIAMNTFAAAGAGAIAALATTWLDRGRPNPTMTLNGVLAGLVAITAGCSVLSLPFAILTGAIAGPLMVYATRGLEWVVDDPVGAIAVHGVCGAWGTLAAGLFRINAFSWEQVGIQFIGIAAAFLWAFPMSFLVFSLIDQAIGLRITLLDKAIGLLQKDGGGRTLGLDRLEHDVEAYPEFVTAEEQSRPDAAPSAGTERSRQPVAS
ncbi:MAG: ammonium transporter [Bacteroidetes bacterium SW_9_63_38]|nr:MAG: ammonium transporter [Bacteroidetes bacterium SW_9_63_38]